MSIYIVRKIKYKEMRLTELSLFDRIKSVFTGEEKPKEKELQEKQELPEEKVEPIEQTEELSTFEEGLEKPRKTFTRRFKEMMAGFRYEAEEFFEE